VTTPYTKRLFRPLIHNTNNSRYYAKETVYDHLEIPNDASNYAKSFPNDDSTGPRSSGHLASRSPPGHSHPRVQTRQPDIDGTEARRARAILVCRAIEACQSIGNLILTCL
jgi:hypothetical protein